MGFVVLISLLLSLFLVKSLPSLTHTHTSKCESIRMVVEREKRVRIATSRAACIDLHMLLPLRLDGQGKRKTGEKKREPREKERRRRES